MQQCETGSWSEGWLSGSHGTLRLVAMGLAWLAAACGEDATRMVPGGAGASEPTRAESANGSSGEATSTGRGAREPARNVEGSAAPNAPASAGEQAPVLANPPAGEAQGSPTAEGARPLYLAASWVTDGDLTNTYVSAASGYLPKLQAQGWMSRLFRVR